ncbi:unnamed protein product, partial [Closterium sp. NIES-54]
MYAFADSAEGDCYLSVPPDLGIAAAALGASASAALGTSASAAPGAGESALSGTAPTEVLHTFTLDSGASRSFFRNSTTLTQLCRPVAVSLADPSGGPVLAHSSTVLLCPAALSGLLSGLHLPSVSTNLVSGADLQDAWVGQFTPGGQRVTHCTFSRTGRHLATFTRRPGSSLYTQNTAPPPVSTSGQVAASSQVFAAASRSSLAYGPCALVSGLPRSLAPLLPGPAPTCVPLVEGRQRAAPHSSSFPPTEAPLQTLHMDVWGPANACGQGNERYFLLVVDDYSRYTTVFPLRSKGEVPQVLIDWIRGARRQLSESFGSDLPVLGLHSDRVLGASDQPSASCLLAGDHTYSTGRAPSGVSQVDPAEPVEVAIDSGATRGAEPAGAGTGGAALGVFVSEGAASWGAQPGRVEPEGTAYGGAAPSRAEFGGALGVPSWQEPLSPQQLRDWYSRRFRGAAGAGGSTRADGGATGARAAAGGAA